MSDRTPAQKKKTPSGNPYDARSGSSGTSPRSKRTPSNRRQLTRDEVIEIIRNKGWYLIQRDVASPDDVKPGNTIWYQNGYCRIRGSRKIRQARTQHRSPETHNPQGDLFGGHSQPALYELVLEPIELTPAEKQEERLNKLQNPFRPTDEVAQRSAPPRTYNKAQIEMIRHVLKYEKFLQEN